MALPDSLLSSVNQVNVAKLVDELGIKHDSRYLMNREKLGVPLRNALLARLHEIQEGTLAVDLSNVEEMTISVTEEIGPKLFEEFILYRTQGREVFLTYCNISDEVARSLHYTFGKWNTSREISEKFSIVVFSSCEEGNFEHHQFLGQEIPEALRSVLDVIYTSGQVTSLNLEDQGIKAASRKLNELGKQYPWLFCKIQASLNDADPRAWAYFYSPIVPVKEKVGVQH